MNDAALVSCTPGTYSIGLPSIRPRQTDEWLRERPSLVYRALLECICPCKCTVVAVGFDRVVTGPVKPED
jgi:hypothetical protein